MPIPPTSCNGLAKGLVKLIGHAGGLLTQEVKRRTLGGRPFRFAPHINRPPIVPITRRSGCGLRAVAYVRALGTITVPCGHLFGAVHGSTQSEGPPRLYWFG